jgi:uncharacterized protein (DUF2141 family)
MRKHLYLLILVGLILQAVCSMASAATVSGAVTNSTGKSGRVYLMLFHEIELDTWENTGLGTSFESTSGTEETYSIRGAAPFTGNYIVKAFLDTRGNRIPFGTSPIGTNGTSFEINSDPVTDKNITLSIPTATPVKPVWVSAAPSSGGSLVFWDTPKNTDNIEIAESYDVQYSTDPKFETGVTTIANVASQDDGHLLVTGLPNGSVYYFRVRAKLVTYSDYAAAPASVTIGDPAGGHTVSGTVNFSTAGATGNLVVVLYNNEQGANYWAKLTQAGETTQNYTISGVPNGSYNVFAFLDRNANNVKDGGDITLVNEPLVQVADSNIEVSPVTLSVTNAQAEVTVDQSRVIDQWGDVGFFDYGLNFSVNDQLKTVANVALVAPDSQTKDLGARVGGDSDLHIWTQLFDRPVAGEIYTFNVSYTDGTSDDFLVEVPDPIDSFPTLTSIDMIPLNGGQPMFTWSIPQGSQITRVNVEIEDSNFNRIWRKEDIYPSLGSIQYNNDGLASLPLLEELPPPPPGEPQEYFTLYLAFSDSNGNRGVLTADFNPTSLPVIKGFSTSAAPVGSLLTLYGFNFEPGATEVIFHNSSSGAASTVLPDGSQLSVTIPNDALTGDISVLTTTGGAGPSYYHPFYVADPVSFTGAVRTSTGLPVEGAEVSLKYYPYVTATTGAEGMFTISGLPGNETFRLKTAKTDYYDTYSSMIKSPENILAGESFVMFTKDDIELLGLTPGNPLIVGKAIDSNGNPLPDVEVTMASIVDSYSYNVLVSASGGLSPGNTSADGLFYVSDPTAGYDEIQANASRFGYAFDVPQFNAFNFAVTQGPIVGTPDGVSIDSFSPVSARPGSTVTINGTFSDAYTGYTATINGLSATITAGDSTSLLIIVPLGATTPGKIAVTRTATQAVITSAGMFTPLYRLSVELEGTGTGAVNSVTAEVPFTCGAATCSQDYPYDTALTLRAAASSGSLFETWSGSCTGNGDCTLILAQDRGVAATFSSSANVRSGNLYYADILTAYSSVSSGAEILAKAMEFPAIDFNLPTSVAIKGGYENVDTESQTGYTTLGSPVTITSGSVTMDRIVVE